MEVYREIIDGRKLVNIINIPKEFISSKIEIIVLPLSHEGKINKKQKLLKIYNKSKGVLPKNYLFLRDEAHAR